MRFLRYLAILAVFALPTASLAHAQVSVGIGIGGPVYAPAYGPPACEYGYFDYAPYACAPYGYYGPEWFTGGLFIGAGPWLRGGYGYRGYGYGSRGYYGRSGYGYGRPGYGYGYVRGYGSGYRGREGGGFRGSEGGSHGGGGGFRGGGGGGFHGGGGSHGGGGRR